MLPGGLGLQYRLAPPNPVWVFFCFESYNLRLARGMQDETPFPPASARQTLGLRMCDHPAFFFEGSDPKDLKRKLGEFTK